MVAHVFLKALFTDSSKKEVEIRGFFMVEEIYNRVPDADWFNLVQPALIVTHPGWRPNIVFSPFAPFDEKNGGKGSGGGSEKHSFRVYSTRGPDGDAFRGDMFRPWWIQLKLAAADAVSRPFLFEIDDWPRKFIFVPKPGGHVQETARESGAAPRVHTVLIPMWAKDMETEVKVLAHHVRHHQKMGFSSHIQYMSEPYLGLFLADPEIQKLVLENAVRFVSCKGLTVTSWNAFSAVFYQHVRVYNHAILTFWGTGEYLAFFDLDEYFVTENKMRVPEVIMSPECGRGEPNLHVNRYNVDCGEGDECGLDSPRDSPRDLEKLWRALPVGGDPLLRMNKLSPKKDMIKSFVNANAIWGFGVHEGAIFGHDQHLFVDIDMPKCGFLVHIVNNHKQRLLSNEFSETKTSWMWMLDEH